MALLRNKISKKVLKEKIKEDTTARITLSFYRYVPIAKPNEMRDILYKEWEALGVLGRTYLAGEGINAQICVPEKNWEKFKEQLFAHPEFKDMRLNVAVEHGTSFYVLTLKVKKQIVADGLPAGTYDLSNVGKHLNAEEWNEALQNENAVCVDMRNFFEAKIGKFDTAITPDVDTFREELPLVADLLKDKKEKKILLYCTGGIRCEKASAYLKNEGFEDVNQLYGGIIHYAHEVKNKGLKSKFKGKNFVFDERIGERITDEIISECDQCDSACDDYTNCRNVMCNMLFIQCKNCEEKFNGCCTMECREIFELPEAEQKELRKKQAKTTFEVYKSRVRPSLK